MSPGPSVPWIPRGNICRLDLQDLGEKISSDTQWDVAELLDIALRNNPDTRKAWAEARAAAYNLGMAESSLYPFISLDEEIALIKETGSATNCIVQNEAFIAESLVVNPGEVIITGTGPSHRKSASYNQFVISTLSASYLLLDFGGRSSNIESARQRLFAVNWLQNRVIQNVVQEVLISFYNHIDAKAMVYSTEETLKEAGENLALAEAQFEAGVKTILDVLQAKASLVNIELYLEQLKGEVHTTRGALAKAMGLPADTIFETVDLPEDIRLQKITESIEELIAIAKEQRPDLAAAEANVLRTRADVASAWSAGMPTLSLDAEYQKTKSIHSSALNTNVYAGVLMLNVPLFTGFLYENMVRRAKEIEAGSCAELEMLESQIFLDVVTSFYSYKTAVEAVHYSDEYLLYSQEAYEAAFENYRAGIGIFLEVLSAQRALADARAKKIDARIQWLTALANIAYSTGRL